jgi:tetratricopeptide (TPR) repeat protein
MSRYSWLVSIILIIVLGAFGISHRNSRARLQDRLRQATAEGVRLAQENRAWQKQALDLRQQREKDLVLIGQLWQMTQAGKQMVESPSRKEAGRKYTAADIKKLLESSGGNLDEVVRRILTPERLQATLQNHLEEPAYWAAVASLLADPDKAREHLEQAAARHPESAMVQAALIENQLARGQLDESTLAAIQALRRTDPNNALADCYEAYYRFSRGDGEGAVQALAAASDKDRFADHRLDLLMSRYQCLLENGCSDEIALGLSAFTLPFPHLSMFREVGEKAIQQAQALHSSGNDDQAVQIADYLLRAGRSLSASGRFIVYDRVGIGLQQAALDAKRQVYESAGSLSQLQEVNYQLGAINERSTQITDMANRFGTVLGHMTEADMAKYIDATILNGEFSTLQAVTSPKTGK